MHASRLAPTAQMGEAWAPKGQIPVCSTARAQQRRVGVLCQATKEVTLLDYGAGNVRSVRNAIKKLGYSIKDVRTDVPSSRGPQRCQKGMD
jgi:glutamine amidotransferase/cyclase